MAFAKFPKIPRLNRDIVVTEKIDGTNGQVYITEPGEPVDAPLDKLITLQTVEGNVFGVYAGSRNRYITPHDDNYGFAAWVGDNAEYLVRTLGPGRHYGEWWGHGIQRGYGMTQPEQRFFSLFNTHRWKGLVSTAHTRYTHPARLLRVPELYRGPFDPSVVRHILDELRQRGSCAVAPSYPHPEGVVVYHTHGNHLYKVTLEDDEKPKGERAA